MLKDHPHIKSITHKTSVSSDGLVKNICIITTDLKMSNLEQGYDEAAFANLVEYIKNHMEGQGLLDSVEIIPER